MESSQLGKGEREDLWKKSSRSKQREQMRQKTSMALKMITGSILKKISRNLMVFSKARIKTVLPSVGGQES